MTAITDRYAQLGGAMGALGAAMGPESPLAGGAFQHYTRGSIYWTQANGAHAVVGAIRERWAALRWERGLLGFPIADGQPLTRNRIDFLVQQFQFGKMELNFSNNEVYVEKATTTAQPNYEVPLAAYIAADTNGGRSPAVNAVQVGQWVDEANRVYAAAGIRFVYDGVLTELRNTDLNNLTGDADPQFNAAITLLNNLAAQRRSIIVLHRFGPDPINPIGGGFSWWTYDFVAMSFFDAVNRNALSILAHELGHHLGLPHTHGMEFPTIAAASDYILSNGPLDVFDGDRDLIDDTPPDLFIPELSPNLKTTGITLAGRAFSFGRKNIMSYWNHGGTAELSHSQIVRVRQLVLERSQRYLNVRVVVPAACAGIMQRLAESEARLAELKADRDSETDPLQRRRFFGAIARLDSQLRIQRNAAHAAGCV